MVSENQPLSSRIPPPSIGGLAFIVGIYPSGATFLIADVWAFRIWIREDGLAEWLTFAVLMVASGYGALM
ncbi:MAG: hypothetical protein OES46_08360 [Gammaproteobacteria bacterium]|nr:hypothetical protein [Gammaproteobacteria bacterium]